MVSGLSVLSESSEEAGPPDGSDPGSTLLERFQWVPLYPELAAPSCSSVVPWLSAKGTEHKEPSCLETSDRYSDFATHECRPAWLRAQQADTGRFSILGGPSV